MDAKASAARRPEGVELEPMSTRSAVRRSFMAVPAARNSGLLRISNATPGL